MNRIVKSTAIAVACLGMAAALAGPALAKARSGGDPLGGLLGGGGGSSLLGGGGQNPLMSLTSPLSALTQSKNPVDGVTRTADGTARSVEGAARLIPQGTFRNGLPLNDAANAAGVEPRSPFEPALTGAESSPLDFGLLNGREVARLEHESDPVPGVVSSLTGRADEILHAPALKPAAEVAVPQVTERLAGQTDHAAFMATTAAHQVGAVSAHDLLSGPNMALKSAMPEAVATELAPVLGSPEVRQPMAQRATGPRTDVPLDEIAPLVEGPLAASPLAQSKGAPEAVGDALGSSVPTTGAVGELAAH
ncbi:hypothetical protein ACIBEJ_46495 [Nonomuraea sp. NPDC050790]|uniref:hypothetical protein n=1 Tax=Nonomuraea sp. NPDC050790 TaxID=3364371 RepID=UPI0037984533